MIAFGLVIQQTNTGLENQFVSGSINVKEPEIAGTLTDERLLATQLANQSNVYCVQTTDRYKIFSLIVTNVTDFFGRAGFIAIRVYILKGKEEVNNIQKLLLDIKTKYISLKENNALASQNYDEIFTTVLHMPVGSPDYISIPNKSDAVIYRDLTDGLDIVFQDKKCNLFHKVYIFEKEKAVDMDIAIRQGMIPFDNYEFGNREINLTAPGPFLTGLTINGQNAYFTPNLREYVIFCKSTDVVTYDTSDGQFAMPINGSQHTIKKKHVPLPPSINNKVEDPEPKFPTSSLLTIIVLMIILLGIGIWYLGFNGGHQDIEIITDVETNPTPTLSREPRHSANPMFTHDSSAVDSNIFKTDFHGLENYRFKFGAKGWSFKNIKNQNTYVPFFKKSVKQISDSDSLKLNSTEILAVIDSLQKVSGHALLDAPQNELNVVSRGYDTSNKNNNDRRGRAAPAKKQNTIGGKGNKATPPSKKDGKKDMKVGEGKI